MIPKILWSICGLVLLFGLGLFFQDYFSKEEPKKIAGTSVNLNKIKLSFSKLPSKNKNAQEPNISTRASFLIDADSFYPLYANNADEKMPVASTTKMTTALVVLENHSDKLSDIVTITPKMISVEGSDIQLRSGEKITVESLLNGLLIMSGNDTAYALAEHFGGKESFVKEMNEKVRSIGVYNTEFKDPAGLDDGGFSTAHDLAVIGAYGLKNKKFAEIVSTPVKTVYSTDGFISHELKNSNRMLRQEEQYYYPNAIGIKTGFTNEAGHVLVSCAQNNGHKLISVVLNTNENTLTASAKESKKLLEWGFANWSW